MSAGRRLAVGGQLVRARLHAIELQGLTIRIHRNLVVAIAVAVPHLDIGFEAVGDSLGRSESGGLRRLVARASRESRETSSRSRGERMRRRFAQFSRRGF